MSAQKALLVFDFDHSFVDGNTDVVAIDARPDLCLRTAHQPCVCWTDFMGHVFERLYAAGCRKEELIEHVAQLKPFPGLGDALATVQNTLTDVIVISDSNSVFIEVILKKYGLEQYFSRVITNPAHFDADGRLRIYRCHAHSCPICPPNMCKGTLLSDYVLANGPYSRITYVGDGKGDLCPSQQLRSCDVIVARTGYPLAKALSPDKNLTATLHIIDFEQSLGSFLQGQFSL